MNGAGGSMPPSGEYRFPPPLEEQLRRLDTLIWEQVGAFDPDVRRVAAHALRTRGKRLRAQCLFLAGWRAEAGAEAIELHVRAAAVVEMVHVATLVHDDILDRNPCRRNRRTAGSRFGAHTAVLLGDAIFAHALCMAAGFPDTSVCRIVSEATRRTCSGEIVQTMGGDGAATNRARYLRIVDRKTGALFAAACRLGAMLADYPEEVVGAVEQFGERCGRAYQMADDLLDVFGDEAQAGKILGGDFRDGRPTLPVILLFEALDTRERHALVRDFGSGDPEALERWRPVMKERGIREAAERELDQACDEARHSLRGLCGDVPPSEALLKALRDWVALRRDALASP